MADVQPPEGLRRIARDAVRDHDDVCECGSDIDACEQAVADAVLAALDEAGALAYEPFVAAGPPEVVIGTVPVSDLDSVAHLSGGGFRRSAYGAQPTDGDGTGGGDG